MTETPPRGETSLPTQPMLNVPWVVLAVAGVLVAVHVLFWALGESAQVWSLYALSFIPARLGGGEAIPYPHGAQIWSFFTYALLHADIYQLGFNCLWLLIFSTPVARRLGPWRYLLLIAGGAAFGALSMLYFNYGERIIVMGANSCVSATLAAAVPLMFAPGFHYVDENDENYRKLVVLSPVQLANHLTALCFVAVFLTMLLLTGSSMAQTSAALINETSSVPEARLAGFIAGLVLFYLLDKKPVPDF